MIKGIDVSHHQGTINWTSVANDGVEFAIIKATEGTSFFDPVCSTNVANAKANGIKVGVYHFARFTSNVEALAEAQYFLNRINGLDLDLPLVLDIEVDEGDIGKSALTAAARTFLDYLKSQDRKVMIYTYHNFYTNDIDATGYPLWIARYGVNSPGINDWTIWQYTDSGSVKGINGNVDVNKAVDSFLYGLTEEPPIDPETPDLQVTGDTDYLVTKDVFLNQMFIENKNTGERVEILGVEPVITDGLNGKKELTFTISLTDENQIEYDMLTNDNIIVIDEKRFKQQRYIILNVDADHIDFTKTISAQHTYVARLVNNDVSGTKTGSLTLEAALNHALKGSGFSYVLASDTKGIKAIEQENFGNQNSISLMDEITEDYKVELDVNNTKIYVYKKMGKRVNYLMDTRYNVSGLKISSSTQNSTTRAWGYGKQDDKGKYLFDPVLYIHPEEKDFLIDGYPRWAEPIRDEKYTKAPSINDALENLVNPYPEVTVNADLELFYDPKLEELEEAFYKGDSVGMIADKGNGSTYEDELRIVQLSYNPLDQFSKPDLTFSNFRKDIYDMQIDDKVRIRRQEKYFRNITGGIRNSLPQQINMMLTFNGSNWFINSSNITTGSVSIIGDAILVSTGGLDINVTSGIVNEDVTLKTAGYDATTDFTSTNNTIKINLIKAGAIASPLENIPMNSQISLSVFQQ